MSLIRAVAREWGDDRVGGLAAEVAFFGILSLFPGLLALAGALGSIGAVIGDDAAADARHEVLTFLERVLTSEASDTLAAVEALFDNGSAGALTLGTAVAIWAASRAFLAVVRALHVAYDIEQRDSYVKERGVALALAAGSVVVFALLLSTLVVGPLLGTGQDVADWLGFGSVFATLWDWLRWPAALCVFVLWATTVLHVGAGRRARWRADVPGAVLATALWVLGSVGLRVYMSTFAGVNQVLGALGGALIALVWLYLLAIGLLLGAELNSELLGAEGRE